MPWRTVRITSTYCADGKLRAACGVLGQDVAQSPSALYRCDGSEEADRFVSADPQVAQFLAGRTSSESGHPRQPPPPQMLNITSHCERGRDSQGWLTSASAGIGSVARCLTAMSASSRCPRNPCHHWRQFRTRTSCWPRADRSQPMVYEARWKAGPDSERELWQGLAQLCVGIASCRAGQHHRRVAPHRASSSTVGDLRGLNGPVYGGPKPHHRMDPRPRTRACQLLADRSAVMRHRCRGWAIPLTAFTVCDTEPGADIDEVRLPR